MNLETYTAKKLQIEKDIAAAVAAHDEAKRSTNAANEVLEKAVHEQRKAWGHVLDGHSAMRRLEDELLHGEHVTLAEEQRRARAQVVHARRGW